MGLDVYLYSCPDLAHANAQEKLYEDACDALWAKHCDPDGKWKTLPKEEQDKRYAIYQAECEPLKTQYGIVGYGTHNTVAKHEADSTKHPEHMFKVGYFRSSYNGSGIDRILHNLGLPDLANVMGAEDKYEFAPDWAKCKERAEALLAAYRAHPLKEYRCFKVGPNMFGGFEQAPEDAEDALQIFGEELGKAANFLGDGYSNIKGEFWPANGLQIYALIPGFDTIVRRAPCVYAICKTAQEGLVWYEQAIEIVIETCEFVLAQPNAQEFYLHWSG